MSQRTNTEDYDDIEYTEEYEYEYGYSSFDGDWVDNRDRLILENQRKIQNLPIKFRKKIKELREELANVCEQYTRIQYEMLDRILDLKQQIKEVNERNEFLKRKLPTTNKKKKSKRKKTIQFPRYS